MKKNKIRLIKSQGTEVEVKRYISPSSSAATFKTIAIIGRGARTNADMYKLEGQKEGIFFPDTEIDSGDFVYNSSQSESYVVSGTHKEPWKNGTISIITNLLKCNHIINVKSNVKVADARGNLKTKLNDIYTGIPCHVEQITNELRQYDSGIHPETDYRVYTTALDIKETDQVTLVVMGKEEQFKAVARDYISFPKMLVLDVCRDIRK
ncbi:hypothetical protein [Brevibacillus laterosporus]|uniref:hypothetical protein n=1 Tax=Brevibacillus laterosporus TaxID=1465 RepID=UPI003D1FA6C1